MNFEIPEAVKVYSQFFHPVFMWVLLGVTLYAGYLGWQIRKTREASAEERKELVKKQFNLKHYQLGSIVLALMVLGTIGGMAVTYINNEKLFFGAHLLTGLSMTGIIAVSAALSPYMQKGNDWARISHITLNTILVGLFAWQALTGMEIVQKLISFL